MGRFERRAAMMAALLAVAEAMTAGAAAQGAPAALGRWRTAGGKGVVEIYRCAAELCGRIVWLKTPADARGKPLTDEHNPSARLRTRPICGLEMLGGFKPDGQGGWTDGWIYDPENGKTYHARMAADGPGTLELRGYVGIPLLGETQTWTRAPASLVGCATG